jgi:hypothetical protein
MSDLSGRFAELMARIAKSDADLFRTIGEQNSAVRQWVDAVNAPECDSLAPTSQSLLPLGDCELPSLKARFKKVAAAQAFAEERIGPAPKKPTWAALVETFRTGQWPANQQKPRTTGTAALEQRLDQLEARLNARLDRLEALLLALPSAR